MDFLGGVKERAAQQRKQRTGNLKQDWYTLTQIVNTPGGLDALESQEEKIKSQSDRDEGQVSSCNEDEGSGGYGAERGGNAGGADTGRLIIK